MKLMKAKPNLVASLSDSLSYNFIYSGACVIMIVKLQRQTSS